MRFKPHATTVKLGIFTLVMVVVLGFLVVIFSQMRFSSETGYHAVFTQSSGMLPGAKVRIAGVPVGTVKRVYVGKDDLAHVDFDVDSKYRLLQSTHAAIRYENLVGDRYMELLDSPGSDRALSEGGTIGTDKTKPALDLDMLLGGFKPLLQGLDPTQVNSLTSALLQVFQGQGGALVALLNSSGSFAKTIADRDALIGNVINDLNTVLGTIDAHSKEFDTTLTELQRLISGLAADRDPIGAALPKLAGATTDLQGLLQEARPDLQQTFTQLGRVATNLDDHSADVQTLLNKLPQAYKQLVRVGSYGSFLNMYVCGTQMLADGPDGKPMEIHLPGNQTTGRCASN
ncbi:MCE family protein [Nocardia vaccinii]|uniref:MCE family protein n=1 Tax=Nocardia vaccinii TaxID=1822 RepID=UPI00082D826C|nr:MlaD family protein [Nocardia vaccinii]